MQRVFFILILGLLIFLADLYVFQAVLTVSQSLPTGWQQLISWLYWGWFVLTFLTLGTAFLSRGKPVTALKTYVFSVVFIVFASKLVVIIFLLLEDGWRAVRYLVSYFAENARNEFVFKRSIWWDLVALLAGAIPLCSLIYGIFHGAFNYKVKKITLQFPNLPASFDGFKMVQISDLHTGSFQNEKPLQRAVKLINEQNADLVFFTGDLVNNVADEVQPYIPVLGQLRGKRGVFSILGNHDYGDYVSWPTRTAKLENLERLKESHARMGWRLLLNEHIPIEKNGEKIAVLGVENWGNRAGFPKYGKLYQAYAGTENIPFKVLLSHDPSHWDGEVNQKYPDIDLMLAGHTHGMQFGINFRHFKWSPVQYVYRQWAGLYEKGNQYLYVNVGLGFIGYPGRVGFLPEITLFELRRA